MFKQGISFEMVVLQKLSKIVALNAFEGRIIDEGDKYCFLPYIWVRFNSKFKHELN